jgi:ABC-type polysaccharide/polyol phosphate transport system ATPase subunit
MLRDVLTSFGRSPQGAPAQSSFWALRDLSLEVKAGEALGIIGHNGSGKSTFLKIVAGVTRPTQGRVEVYGRVGALIEVGTGLHPELSGQENIFLYGTILGLPRQEIRRKFDDIVQFSELHEFLDVPLKRYSSGMRVRLGFAVAAHLDPHVLLVDEVLAVGDVAFQRKCVRYIRTLQERGTTIIFISHELPTVERICQRVVWLDAGQIREVGGSGEVVHHYLDEVERASLPPDGGIVAAGRAVTIERVTLSNGETTGGAAIEPGDPMTVTLHYRVTGEPFKAVVTLKIVDDQWTTLLMARGEGDGDGLVLADSGTIRCDFPSLPLAAKAYQVVTQVLRLPDHREEIPWQAIAGFTVRGQRHELSPHPLDVHDWDTPVLQIPAQWSLAGRARAGVTDG